MGYEKAINLEGGFEAWEAAGYPVEGGEKEEPGSTEAKGLARPSRVSSSRGDVPGR
jgi:3-mercaptopyruvate sulfurtransferase SseA